MSSPSLCPAPPSQAAPLDSAVTSIQTRLFNLSSTPTVTLCISSDLCSFSVYLPGACGEDKVNVLSLRNGSSTTDMPGFVSDWTVAADGRVCLPKRRAVCASGAVMGCQALRSEAFEPCHAHIPVQVFLAKCEEQACEDSDVCELISAFARLCRQRGVCVDWRSPHLCRKSVFDAYISIECRAHFSTRS